MKPLSKEEITTKVKEVLKTDHWMIRRSNNGRSYEEFQWNPVGVWTEAPDWDPSPVCGGGLHGCNQKSGGYRSGGDDVDFCMTDGEEIDIDGEKIKCKRAMVLLRNELPDNLSVGGSLYLDHSNIVQLSNNLSVGGALYLGYTSIIQLPNNLSVGGGLYLDHTNITQLPNDLSVGGNLDLSHTNITRLPDNLKVCGSLDLAYTNIVQLPDNLNVNGSLYLDHTSITQLPNSLRVGRSLYLDHTTSIQPPNDLNVRYG